MKGVTNFGVVKKLCGKAVGVIVAFAFSILYSSLFSIVLIGLLYTVRPEPPGSTGGLFSYVINDAEKYKEIISLCNTFDALSVLSFILIIALLVFNWYVYTKPCFKLTKAHLMLELLLFAVFIFPLWKTGEEWFKSLYTSARGY